MPSGRRQFAHPAWAPPPLRRDHAGTSEASPFTQRPRFLIWDNDSTHRAAFSRTATTSGIEEVCPAYRAPKENAICERFLGSVRRECLDHLLILSGRRLRRILQHDTAYFNNDRPHQGLQWHITAAREVMTSTNGQGIMPIGASRKGSLRRSD